MSIAFVIVLALVVAAPVLTFTSDNAGIFAASLTAAISVIISSWAIGKDELKRATRTLRRVWPLFVVPAAWMLIQLLPLPLGNLSHPIWKSAAAALPELRFGYVTIGFGDTVGAIAFWLSVSVLVFASMLVCVARRRAELCLATLVIATTSVASFGITELIFGGTSNADTASTAGILGCILSSACAGALVERRLQHRDLDQETSVDPWLLILTAIGFVMNGSAVILLSSSAWIVALLGVITFGFIALTGSTLGIRGLHCMILPLIVLAAATVFAARYETPSEPASIIVGIAEAPSEAKTTASRLTSDNSNWLGTGSGTYARAARNYQNLGQQVQTLSPSTMIKLEVELGWLAPYLLTAAALWFAALLIIWATDRGRDAFYSAAAAACVVSLTIESYLNASLLIPTISVLAALIAGLGLAQAHGRLKQH